MIENVFTFYILHGIIKMVKEMYIEDIMKCIAIVSEELPTLRDILDMTQQELASIIGISRQSVIDLEHKKKKITRSVLIAIIAYFSLRKETAVYLDGLNFYNIGYVKSLGLNQETINKLYSIGNE